MAATSQLTVARVVRALATRLRFERTGARHVWSGVHAAFRDADIGEVSYATSAYLDNVDSEARGYLALIADGGRPQLWHDGLSLLAGCAAAAKTSLHVVDFGGGLATGYLQIREDLPARLEIRYDVVEIPELAARGRQTFADHHEVRFHTSLDEVPAAPDILYVNSALQYLEDYGAILDRLAQREPEWLLLDRAAIGPVPTFVTVQQNVPGMRMRYWFLNREEVADRLGRHGYQLVQDGEVGPVYDQSNLPETHRIGRMRRLLFRRSETPA